LEAYEIDSLCKTISHKDKLVNRIMDATQIKNSPGMVERAVRSLLHRARLCIKFAGENFEHLLNKQVKLNVFLFFF